MSFYIKKLFDYITTLFLVTLLTFFTFNIIPGNPAIAILGPDADEVKIQQLEKEFNLDKPLYQRYFSWIKNVLQGDLGMSYRFNKSVSEIIFDSATTTLTISLFTIILTIIIGFSFGIIFGHFSNNSLIKSVELLNQVFISTPSFCTALLLILIFTVKLNIFPSMGYIPFFKNPIECIKSIFLPSLSLALGSSAILARYLKTNFIEEKNKDYVKTAYSKGLSSFYINFHHILRNSLISVITAIGLILTEILGGSIIIENVFSIPGIGKLITTSISSRDFPLIQGITLYLASICVLCNFSIEIIYSIIDPRIKNSNNTFFIKKIRKRDAS